MAIQRYCLSWDWKADVVVDIDREIATDEKLHMINNFWTNAEDRLEEANGDVLVAVLKMLCTKVVSMSIEYLDVKDIFAKRGGATEGWPALDGSWGITLVRYDELEFDDDDVEVREISHG
ncbi:DUF2528 family protein [Pseudogulbenkiania sp. MAI-1]|uniref:DUF2528 family protein n=1 Tax=Pseudogulbenkiania sp. MAI-1 TaxID=990370 RepID=UPI00045EC108|nr:DUF2528 family protein [Pseudogulbenkiania sp. MAI-1]